MEPIGEAATARPAGRGGSGHSDTGYVHHAARAASPSPLIRGLGCEEQTKGRVRGSPPEIPAAPRGALRLTRPGRQAQHRGQRMGARACATAAARSARPAARPRAAPASRDRRAAPATARRTPPGTRSASTGPRGMPGGRRSGLGRSAAARAAAGRRARGAAGSLPAAKRACSAARRRSVAERYLHSSIASGPSVSCRRPMPLPIARFTPSMNRVKRGIRPVGREGATNGHGRGIASVRRNGNYQRHSSARHGPRGRPSTTSRAGGKVVDHRDKPDDDDVATGHETSTAPGAVMRAAARRRPRWIAALRSQ